MKSGSYLGTKGMITWKRDGMNLTFRTCLNKNKTKGYGREFTKVIRPDRLKVFLAMLAGPEKDLKGVKALI